MIHLKVTREPSTAKATPGKLYYRINPADNWTWHCYTLEDVAREVEGQPVEIWKRYGETAIPYGVYKVTLGMSQRFGKLLPRILDVPGFDGVLIHGGNTAADTHGCILVAHTRPNPDTIQGACAHEIVGLIQAAGGTAELTITSTGAPNDLA